MVLASNNIEQSIALAENIRQTINDFPFEQNVRLTVSIGLAEYQYDETGLEWLARADVAMYQAKSAGRDLCCLAGS